MEKIAIIGMGCLLPGYTTRYELWDALIAGKCLTTEDMYNNQKIERGHLHKDESSAFFKKYFTAEKFQHLNEKGELYKWSAYVVEEALKESGYSEKVDVLERTGIIMGTLGMFVPEYISMFDELLKAKLDESINLLLKDGKFEFSNKYFNPNIKGNECYVDTDNVKTIRELYSLKGPYMSLSAACATPLYAIKMACFYLQTHKADLMIAGANCENESVSDVCAIFESLGILVGEGECNPLNEGSNGLIISSGAGAVALKRLGDAVRDDDHILAVIDNIGWSNDGGAKSLLAPCTKGQEKSFRNAYTEGISDDIDYIECHSTGTAVGDMEEYKTIQKFWSSKEIKPYIGTIKGNTGHFLTASAMGSLIKVVLSMQNNIIPKTIRLTHPISPTVVTRNIPWPNRNREKRAAINAFGFGGINAHMVLREYVEGERQIATLCEEIKQEVVIVGMDLQLGEIKNKEDFFEHLVNKEPMVTDNGARRFGGDEQKAAILKALGIVSYPKGAYVNEIPFDFFKFRFSARKNMYYARRDMLLLNVVNQALTDSGIVVSNSKETAVIINGGQDFAVLNYRVSAELREQLNDSFNQSCPGLSEENREQILQVLSADEKSIESADSIVGMIPTIRGSRISSHWKFEGPSFILTEQDEALEHSLEIAEILLNNGGVKCVVIGTVELLGETEFLYAQKLKGNLGEVQKYGIGEGAGVLVLKSKEQALKDQDTVYATLEEVKNSQNFLDKEYLKRATGYSGSLQQYTEVIVLALERYYNFQLNNYQKYSKDQLFTQLHQKRDMNIQKVLVEKQMSLIKNISTSLPELSKREHFQGNIHKFRYTRTQMDIKAVPFVVNYEQYIKQLEVYNQKVESLVDNIHCQTQTIWNRDEIIEMTTGNMSKILGVKYKSADQYKIRSRMPSPPYLFVSRITKIEASYGKLAPASIEIEYDVDEECIYLQGNNKIANVVFTEASQIGIFLGSYIGVDITSKGALRFRIVDSKITFVNHIAVGVGDTLRLSYRLEKFIKRGDTLVVFCSYSCYKGTKLILKTEAIGGFFTEQDLIESKGMAIPKIMQKCKVSNKQLRPNKWCNKTVYNKEEMEAFFDGRLHECFGDSIYEQSSQANHIRSEVRMLDQVTEVSFNGGKYGLGYICAKKKIDTSHWAFQVHFKNDPVFPGTLILNGANQLLLFFALHCGFALNCSSEEIGPIEGMTANVAFRGQIKPKKSEILYRIDIKDVIAQKETEALIAEINVFWEEKNVIREDNSSLNFGRCKKKRRS